jgi:tRNA (guanosine-2'-O-)-methyltransferase
MTPERREKLLSVLSRRQGNLTVVLENVFDPHNVSAVMRTCDAVGVQDLYILNTRIPLNKKWGFKSSRSANRWMTIHQFTDPEACFSEVKKSCSKILTTRLSAGSLDLYQVDFTESIALVFGNECYGVTEDILKYSDASFSIPQVGIIKSLNISVACAVTLYEAFRQKNLAGHYDKPSLHQDKMNNLYRQWGFENNEYNDK